MSFLAFNDNRQLQTLGQHCQQCFAANCFPQAVLFIGANTTLNQNFIFSVINCLLCDNFGNICKNCQSCHFLQLTNAAHPDLIMLNPESGSIKIDTIRSMQDKIMLTPQISTKKIIFIRDAQSLNPSAANALLKILEEPPQHAIFILFASQIAVIPVTVVSRCQHWYLPIEVFDNSYIDKNLYLLDKQTNKNLTYDQIISQLLLLKLNKIHIYELLKSWENFSLKQLIEHIYMLNSQMIYNLSMPAAKIFKDQLQSLAVNFSLTLLFKQQDLLSHFLQQFANKINLNKTLVLEGIILGYLQKII